LGERQSIARSFAERLKAISGIRRDALTVAADAEDAATVAAAELNTEATVTGRAAAAAAAATAAAVVPGMMLKAAVATAKGGRHRLRRELNRAMLETAVARRRSSAVARRLKAADPLLKG